MQVDIAATTFALKEYASKGMHAVLNVTDSSVLCSLTEDIVQRLEQMTVSKSRGNFEQA